MTDSSWQSQSWAEQMASQRSELIELGHKLQEARHCVCRPWEQSWRAETPDVCATCRRPFKTYSRAREVCLKTEGCLLLPDHEGLCDSNQESKP